MHPGKALHLGTEECRELKENSGPRRRGKAWEEEKALLIADVLSYSTHLCVPHQESASFCDKER